MIGPGSSFGDYRVVRALGRGGMGAVYEAVTATGERAAIKVALDRSDAESLERFRREARAAKRVGHPNVAYVLDAGEVDGLPYLVVELLTGGSLADRLAASGPIPWREAADLGARIARGLAAIHEAGLVHRDLKPANVLLDGDGEVKVSDFGLARTVGRGSVQLTKTGEMVGTYEYLAPEQAEGGEAVDGRADLYALGGTLFALLTGEPPFAGSGIALVTKHIRERPRPVRSLTPEVPEAFDRLVQRLLEKAPEERGTDAEALAALEALARPGSPARRRVAVGLALAAAVAVLALGTVLVARALPGASPAPRPSARPASPTPRPDPTPSAIPSLTTLDWEPVLDAFLSEIPLVEVRGRVTARTTLPPVNRIGHTRAVTCAAVVHAGIVVSGGLDGRVCLWNEAELAQGKSPKADIDTPWAVRALAATAPEPQGLVLAVGETPDGAGAFRLFKLPPGATKLGKPILGAVPRPLSSARFATADVAFAGGEDGLFRIDVPGLATEASDAKTLVDHAPVVALARGIGGLVYAGYADGQIKAWSARSLSGDPIVTRSRARAPLRWLDVLGDSRESLLVLDGGDGETRGQAHLVSLEPATLGQELGTPLDLGWDRTPAAVFGASPDMVVAADESGRPVARWRSEGGWSAPPHPAGPAALRHRLSPLSLSTSGSPGAPDRRYLTTSWDHSIRRWRVDADGAAPECETVFEGVDRVVALACVLPAGAASPYLGVAWEGPTRPAVARVALDGSSSREDRGCPQPAQTVALSPDGTLAAGHGDGRARLWRPGPGDAGAGRAWREVSHGGARFRLAGFLEDPGRFVTAADDGRLRLHDLRDAAARPSPPGGQPVGGGLVAAVLGLEGTAGTEGRAPRDVVVTASDASAIVWWQVAADGFAEESRVARPDVRALAIDARTRSADRVAVGFSDGLELVARKGPAGPAHRRSGHPGVEALAWSGRLVAACCADATVRVYETGRLAEVARVDFSKTTAQFRTRPTAVVFDPRPAEATRRQILHVGTDRGAVVQLEIRLPE